MKKEWINPLTIVQKFAANEYIAACGDSGVVYNFECDASAGDLYVYYNKPYPWSSKDYYDVVKGEGFSSTTASKYDANLLGSFTPCPAAHEAESTSGFYWGFIDYDENGEHGDGETVIVWRGEYGINGHATKNLNMNSWETAKS